MVIIGRITQNATVKKVKDHNEVVNFAVAVNDFYKPKGAAEDVTLTTYYNCAYWISTKIASRLTKGSLVELQGRANVNAYKGMDGEPRASLNFHVNSVTVHLHKKADNAVATEPKVAEDLPF